MNIGPEWLGLVLIPLAMWGASWWTGRVKDGEVKAKEEGRTEAMAANQRAATHALHRRLDDMERKLAQHGNLFIAHGWLRPTEPSGLIDTQDEVTPT